MFYHTGIISEARWHEGLHSRSLAELLTLHPFLRTTIPFPGLTVEAFYYASLCNRLFSFFLMLEFKATCFNPTSLVWGSVGVCLEKVSSCFQSVYVRVLEVLERYCKYFVRKPLSTAPRRDGWSTPVWVLLCRSFQTDTWQMTLFLWFSSSAQYKFTVLCRTVKRMISKLWGTWYINCYKNIPWSIKS